MPAPGRPDPPRPRRGPGLTQPVAAGQPPAPPPPPARAGSTPPCGAGAAPRHAAVWVIPPRPWPCRKRGGTTSAPALAARAKLGPRAGKPASSEQIGQGHVRTTYPRGNPGQHGTDRRPGRPRMAPATLAPDPPDRPGDELRVPAGRRAAGTLER